VAGAAEQGADDPVREAARSGGAHQHDGGDGQAHLPVRSGGKSPQFSALRAAEAEAQALRAAADPVEMAAASDPYAVSDPAQLNYAWATAGTPALLPTRAFDDGDAVFLTWPQGIAIPAILITNEDGDEGPVNYTVRGDTVVVDGVPVQIILRSGRETATLTNTGPMKPAARRAGLDIVKPSRESN
jgi:type IV secretion system protein VirB9